VALRDDPRHGDRAAVSASRLLHLESDHPDAWPTLQGFTALPSLVIASGTPGHLHAYWQLDAPALPEQVRAANRRLAQALGGELACAGIARLLRPPRTLNHKHQPPRPVRRVAYRPQISYSLSELTAALPPTAEPQLLPTRTSPRTGGVRAGAASFERALLEVSAADYVAVLVKAVPNRQGKILCPFHEEREASLQLYPDGTFYCFGASCGRGGTIIDFAAHLWLTGQSRDVPLRGREFIDVRRRLMTLFFGENTDV
jgi:hypothetical protein